MSQSAIVITGGAGYIGSHIAKLFLSKGFKVIIIDNLFRGYKEAIDILQKLGELEFSQVDILDTDSLTKIFQANEVKLVIHCAALCYPDESIKLPLNYYEANVLGTLSLMQAMASAKIKSLIFSSTCAVYGEAQDLPINEDHRLKPLTPYGLSKLLAEQAIILKDLNYIIFRFFNVCGADRLGLIGDSKKPSQLLMQNAIRGALGIEKFSYTCGKVKTPDTTPIRDYIDVEDLANAHFLAYEYLQAKGNSQIINLGSGKGLSVKQIVDQVEKTMGVLLEKNQSRPRSGEYSEIYASADKAKKILNWQPSKSLADSVKSLVNWYKKYPNGYRY